MTRPEFEFDEQIDSGEGRMNVLQIIAYIALIASIPTCAYLGYLAANH